MILKKFYKKKIPSFRHKTDIAIFDKLFIPLKNRIKKKYILQKNLIVRRKKFYNAFSLNTFYNIFNYNNFLVKLPIYTYKPYKKFFLCEDIYNNEFIIPGIENINSGNIYFISQLYLKVFRIFCFKGLPTYLQNIPFNINFSNVGNFFTQKVTYAKSAGTYCKIRKFKKGKKKLILIILPSNKEIYLTKQTIVYIGKNQNFYSNKLIEGKYGFSFHNFKKINVRGVAMNPVDHPNGGRAKSVQPEKSPWNWIAKRTK